MKDGNAELMLHDQVLEARGKVEKKAGKRIGYNYIIIKSLKESVKNDVVKCLYIKSLVNFGFCVIKEGSYGDSKDKEGRDIKDRLIWQKQLHEQLHDKVRMPKLLGSFEEKGNYYLVIECIKGNPLYKICRDNSSILRHSLMTGNKTGIVLLDYLSQIAGILESLHQHKIVHRDVTAANFIIQPNGKVAVIDMELSYSIAESCPSPPFKLGTYGYMSPEQLITDIPTIKEDVFSMGAVMLQVWTGISPIKLTEAQPEKLRERINFFVPDKIFAETIFECLQSPEVRPALTSIYQTITDYRSDIVKKKARVPSATVHFKRQQVLGVVQQAIHTFSSPLLADEKHGWFSENLQIPTNPDKTRINKAWYASFSRGASGVIYLLSVACGKGIKTSMNDVYVEKALELIKQKYISNPETVSPGLHFGAAGIAVSLMHALDKGLIKQEPRYKNWIRQLLVNDNTENGFMTGIAGQAVANWHYESLFGADDLNKRQTGYLQHILDTQQKDGSWVRALTGRKKRFTKGFAHGAAGIIYFLLEYAGRYKNGDAWAAATKGLDWLTKKAYRQGETIQWRSSTNKEITPSWCEGGAGIALSFLKAYSISGETKYRDFATGALRAHNRQVLNNNLSQCHGLTGFGEIYLEAYNILEDEEWLERADWIVQVIMHLQRQHPQHGVYWLVEHERQPVADFMVGNSGIIHFLLRFCYPEEVGFPLLYIPKANPYKTVQHPDFMATANI